jgi:hypothetical protein
MGYDITELLFGKLFFELSLGTFNFKTPFINLVDPELEVFRYGGEVTDLKSADGS